MKKLAIATLLAVSSVTVFAQNGGFQGDSQTTSSEQVAQPKKFKEHRHHEHKGGGFLDSETAVSKISDKGNWKDEQHIALQGNIVKQVGKKDFLFRDATGEVEVEIDRRAWNGQEITPKDEVKIFGEVDKSWDKTEVEIHHIQKIK